MSMMELSFLAAFIGGLISFFSPCVVPLMPIFIAYLSGIKPTEIEKKKGKSQKTKVFSNAVAFVIGFSIVFIMLGTIVGLLSQSFPGFRSILSKVGGVIIIALGLQTLGLINIPFLSTSYRVNVERITPSYLSSVLIGGAFAIGWTPCVSGILASIFVLASVSASAIDGAVLLAVYSAGFAIPFLILGYFTSEATSYINKYNKYLGIANIIAGILLIILGIIVFTERFQELISRLI